MKSKPELLKDGEQQLDKLTSLLSAESNVTKINQKIITYVIVKLCYYDSSISLLNPCNVMNRVIESTNSTSCVQQSQYRKCSWLHSSMHMYVLCIYTYVRTYDT